MAGTASASRSSGCEPDLSFVGPTSDRTMNNPADEIASGPHDPLAPYTAKARYSSYSCAARRTTALVAMLTELASGIDALHLTGRAQIPTAAATAHPAGSS